jgi:hypothetical protein
MDADRRSAVFTGVFFIIGTVVGLIGLGVVLEPLRCATDYLTVYGESETRVLVASLLEESRRARDRRKPGSSTSGLLRSVP